MSRSLVLSLAVAALAAAPAHAGFYVGQTLDGPSADIVRVGGTDLARDGSGGVVYVKRDAGVEHVFVTRIVGGVWQPPERVDGSIGTPSGEPVIAASVGGQLAVAFTSGGQLYTVVRPGSAAAWTGPQPIASGAATPSIDLSTNAVGYLAWTQGGDVRAARMDRRSTSFGALADPVDIDPSADAGSGAGRPEIVAGADGNGIVTWGEAGHVYVRRLIRRALSTVPQEASVADFAGHAGGTADLPAIDAADDTSFAWVAFRQTFDNGATRVLARRLVGSAFDPPYDVAAGGFSGGFAAEATTSPALDIAGNGDGVFAADTVGSHTPSGSLLYVDQLGAPFAAGSGSAAPSTPQVTIGENSNVTFAWQRADAPGSAVAVHARAFKLGKPTDKEAALTDPTAGGVDPTSGFAAASDRVGDSVVAWIQVAGADRRLVAGGWDRPPTTPYLTTAPNWRNGRTISWIPGSDPWGLFYRVVVDGTPVGDFSVPSFAPKGRIGDGVHRWQVLAVDSHGQASASSLHTLRIDTHGPQLSFRVKGRKKAGKPLVFVARAADVPVGAVGTTPIAAGARGGARAAALQASGLRSVRFNFGDGTVAVGTRVRHRFRAGTWTVRATAFDRVGNYTAVTQEITIRR